MNERSENEHRNGVAVDKAKNLFRYLAEIKQLQSPLIRDLSKYDKVIWLSEVPREDDLCSCRAWSLFDGVSERPEDDAWVSVHKPKITPPPRLPEAMEGLVNLREWRDSSLEQPSLDTDPLREDLIQRFLPDEDPEIDVEVLRIDDHEDVFDEYVRYIEEEWHPWAETARQRGDTSDAPPAVPSLLQPWVEEAQLSDAPLEEPALSEEISVENDWKLRNAQQLLEEQWASYLENEWHPWAGLDRRLQRVRKIYNDLYVMYQTHQRLGEQFEVVMGFGLLRWPSASGGKVERHVLVCDASLTFDPGLGELAVSGNPNGLHLRAETDMLEPSDRPQRVELEGIEKEVAEAGEAVWDETFLRHMPLAFVNALSDERGRFAFSLSLEALNGNAPQIDLAPAVILRRRSQRGYVRLLNQIEEWIDGAQEVPLGIRELIDPEAAESARQERLEAARKARADLAAIPFQGFEGRLNPLRESDDIYFPLPANKEQFEIASRLKHGRGVLVQGPPGTGKTHTIANLICHLLATGERVLVTSETPRGLQSLRGKFEGPARPLAELCVHLLGDDKDSIKSLEQSVRTINAKLSSFDQDAAENEVSSLKEQLLKVRSEKRKTDEHLLSLREADTYVHTNRFGGYRGTIQTIIKAVATDAPAYDWFLDDVDPAINLEDVFVVDRATFVREWLGTPAPNDWGDLDGRPVDLDALRPAEMFAPLVGELLSREKAVQKDRNLADPEISTAAKDIPRQDIRALAAPLNAIFSGMRELEGHVYPWAGQVGKDVVSEQDRRWRTLLRVTEEEIAKCADRIDDAARAQIEGVAASDARKFLKYSDVLLEHVDNGNNLNKGFSLFQPKPIKAALKAIKIVKVDGHVVENKSDLLRLTSWLIVNDVLSNLQRRWGSLAPSREGPLELQLAEYHDLVEPLRLAVDLHEHVVDAQRHISTIKLPKLPALHSTQNLHGYICALELQDKSDRLAELQGDFEMAQREARSVLREHRDFAAHIDEAFSVRDADKYASTIDQITEFNLEVAAQEKRLKTARSVRDLFPKTFAALSESADLEMWLSRFSDLEQAIEWKRASSRLSEECRPDHAEAVNTRITALQQEERSLLGEVAAAKAWLACLSRFTEVHRQSLVAWRQAISRVGKGGKGKYAALHRATARQELKRCQPAIPAWVMPLHRVVENVDAEPEQFDVAIIDEASQSGPEAVILNHIAKKVVVVGDDKQIRPLNVGTDLADVEQLRRQYIADIDHSESFGLNSSYFSQADLRFANNIRLKEHFRCMPEIILFSNNQFYSDDPLIPLRQFGGERLLPVVSAEYVEGGFVKGKGTRRLNEPEARRVAELIANHCKDAKYDGKSMGVICLTGGEQEQLIRQLLVDTIEAEEIERRELLVGRPYTFQGDERDVIFLSMVNAPEGARRCRKVTGAARDREFNVAASRARDQLVLVHSATLNELSPECLQYRLLDHCQNPRVEQPLIDGATIDQIRIASRSERVQGAQPSPFDSWFEVDVFLRIVDHGYQVIPQYEVNPFDRSYRIDLVVVGVHGRLAVECDGDYWHGPDQFAADMARQRELERAGWTFWRVRGGAFDYDPEKAMESLWRALDENGIQPHGAEEDVCGEQRATQDVPEQAPDEEDARDLTRLSSPPKRNDQRPSHAPKATLPVTDNDDGIAASEIQEGVVGSLRERTNNSIALKSMTGAVCKTLGLSLRGKRRKQFAKRINMNIGALKRKGVVEEYKTAKNVRIRLVARARG